MKHWILVALSLLSAMAAPMDESDCTTPCPGIDNSSTGGSVPPGVTWSLLWATPTPGTGTLNCAATCMNCEMVGSVIFNGNQTTGVCLRVNLGGVGGSAPLPAYARPGKLASLCDNSYCVYFQFVACSTGSTLGFDALTCLVCGCGEL